MKLTLVTKSIRTRLKKAMSRNPVLAAVAFVSDVTDLPLGAGDTVVCDASTFTASKGSTRKDALLILVKNKVSVWSVERLHAKIVVVGATLFVGSANWSVNSDKNLVEAMVETDDAVAVAAAKAFIEGLIKNGAKRVNKAYIKNMPEPPPSTKTGTRRRFGGGTKHWLVSTNNLSERLRRDAAIHFDPHQAKLEEGLEQGSSISWLRWPPSSSSGARISEGDWITMSWREEGEKSVVYPPYLVVDNQKREKHRGVFYRTELDTDGHTSWKQFFKAAVQAGMVNTLTDRTNIEIKPEQAKVLSAWWSARYPSLTASQESEAVTL